MNSPHDLVLVFRRGLYYSRFWFFCPLGKPMNVIAVLRRQLPDGKWRFEYRFRYFEDENVFKSKDRKSFYSGEFDEPMTEEAVIERLAPAIEALEVMLGAPSEVTVIGSDDPEVVHREMSKRPYFHISIDPKGTKQ